MSALWLVAGFAGLVVVDGTTTCPAPAEVAERLRELLPEGEAAAPDRAALSDGNAALQVELRDAAGALLASRRIGGSGAVGCRDLAATAAAAIAAWEAELRPGTVPVPSLAIDPVPAIPAELSVGVAAAISDAKTPGVGVKAEGTIAGRRWGRWALALQAAWTTPREVDLPPGSAAFMRPQLGIGGRFRLSWRRLRFDLHGPHPLVALMWVQGARYDPSYTAWGANAGAGLGVRVSADLGVVALWVSASGSVWLPQRAEIIIQSSNEHRFAELPGVEALVAAGFAYGTGR